MVETAFIRVLSPRSDRFGYFCFSEVCREKRFDKIHSRGRNAYGYIVRGGDSVQGRAAGGGDTQLRAERRRYRNSRIHLRPGDGPAYRGARLGYRNGYHKRDGDIRVYYELGVFIGATLPFVFGAMTMESVGEAANEMVVEVRRQFHEIPGLLEGKARGDYRRCVDISTAAALNKMIAPGVIAIAFPIIIGMLLGPAALGGMIGGALAAGVLLAIMMANAGGAWDNAKKYIESGVHGGKGSDPHKAAVTGDTVGDPFKDTSGPAMNILLKLMTIVSLVFAPVLAAHGGILLGMFK